VFLCLFFRGHKKICSDKTLREQVICEDIRAYIFFFF
jgi:hypothetical protein